MLSRTTVAVITLLLGAIAPSAIAAEPSERVVGQRFREVVQPFLKNHCFTCHGEKKQESKLDLSQHANAADVVKNQRVWDLVLERLEADEMPPADAPKQPAPHERLAVVEWIRASRDLEARKNAGDPGPVLAHRLSNAELDYTVRDLTGVDIRPTREFPVDPANEAGFDNSGESLAMSPALLKKYLAAARRVTDHLVLKPDGFDFAPHPAVTDTDRDKYCVKRIIDFYNRHQVDYADYFLAAWRFKHRAALGKPSASLAEIASGAGLSPKYLANVWSTLTETQTEAGPLATLRSLWRKLPADPQKIAEATRDCKQMRDFVVRTRKELEARVDRLQVRGISPGSQPFVLWRNRQLAAQHMRYPGGGFSINAHKFEQKLTNSDGSITLDFAAAEGSDRHYVVWPSSQFRRAGGPRPQDEKQGTKSQWTLREFLEKHAPAEAAKLHFGQHPLGHALDADSFVLKAPATVSVTVPAKALFRQSNDAWSFTTEGAIDRESSGGGPVLVRCAVRQGPAPREEALASGKVVLPANDPAIPQLEAALNRFCQVFPDAFVVSDRAPYFDPKAAGQGRLLTAGFHLMQGFFRDDEPLCTLVLDDAAQRELDGLWRELDFIALIPLRQYKDYIFFERAEPPRFMIETGFDFARSEDKSAITDAKIQQLCKAYLAKARRIGVNEDTVKIIEKHFNDSSLAIREVEKARLAAEPGHLRALLKFAERAYRRPLSRAERDDLLGFYRDLRSKGELSHEDAIRDTLTSVLMSPYFCYRFDRPEPGESARPLSDYALASRLSYFLWSSMPDEVLLAHAAAGDLHQPAVLVEQARRMVRDPRIRGLATEFAANWLDFRRFEEHNGVDRERFSSFTNELRQAMYEEPLRFFIDVASGNHSVLEMVVADHTFVNPVLAKHYGMPVPNVAANDWVRVDGAQRYGRGGLPPMSVFLTANSPGLRTSPVKRGYWVVRRLLGERIPPPPPTVPELPKDEASSGDLTLPKLLARHRADKSCAGCHDRFDSIGLTFEGYGPIGERRALDLGGRPVETKATFPDGSTGDGLDGLRRYLSENRQDDFVDNLCRKLLAYALGRGLLLSDESAVKNMRKRLESDGHRFGGLVESIVTSPQFLNRRGRDDPRER